MQEDDGTWLYKGKASSRLWEKSAIGRPSKVGGVFLSPAEIIFCLEHRGIKISEMTGSEEFQDWLSGQILEVLSGKMIFIEKNIFCFD